jgi:hypothetical protein
VSDHQPIIWNSSRDLKDDLAKLDSEALSTMLVLIMGDAGDVKFDEGHRAELQESLIAPVVSGSVKMFIADVLGGVPDDTDGKDEAS